MSANVKKITDLRDTNMISKECHESDEPIIITKNGYDDLVVLSSNAYKNLNKANKKNEDDFPKQSSCYSMIRVACATNNISVACPSENAKSIIQIIENNKNKDIDILVFPELSISGYSCGDLFYQNSLINACLDAIEDVRKATEKNHTLIFIGAPLIYQDKLFNCAIALCNGEILGVVPKSNLPNYNEFYEARQFVEFEGDNTEIIINNKVYPFGTKILFVNKYQTRLKVSCELCEDLWAVNTPSTSHALSGANVIVNLSASNELFGKDDVRRTLVKSTSNRLMCAYLYASAGNGESTQDLVYSGHNIIAENGAILSESELFSNDTIISEIDIDRLEASRRKSSSFKISQSQKYKVVYYEKKLNAKELTRFIDPTPFWPTNESEYQKYAYEVIRLQTMGLAKRLKHIHSSNVVIGISGGLDSTLALIVCYETFKYLNLDCKGIHTITMPCFGTSDRTYNNALELSKIMHTTLKNIPISASVTQHLSDLNHDNEKKDITFENAQARERTQVLFDYANMVNGFVIGTGDLSELALGWCTYNGDHMSNYGVNASVPKTLVRFLVQQYADSHEELKTVLYDILDTPISPELLPTNKGQIAQVTEDIVGPYELHDFFLYYLLKYNYSTEKIYYYAIQAFKGKYSNETIYKWLTTFIKRFFAQQFKRSTLPDGPKVTEISLSPRGDFRMPSDALNLDFQLK